MIALGGDAYHIDSVGGFGPFSWEERRMFEPVRRARIAVVTLGLALFALAACEDNPTGSGSVPKSTD
jgi:hypothetical protein